MELDKRILPGKRPLGCFDTEAAKEFIGKEGYFCRYEHLFSDAKKIGSTSVLVQIKPEDPAPFVPQIAMKLDQFYGYEYFLPAEWLKSEEPKKKWRPFSINEWRHHYAIGEEIIHRIKGSNTYRVYMYCGRLSDHDDNLPGKGVINLGGELFVLQNLFDQFELCEDSGWQPFGVEEAL